MAIEFHPADEQELPLDLPGTHGSSFADPLGEKAIERVPKYAQTTRRIARGEKQTVGGENKGGKWYSALLRTMSDQGYLTEEVGAYIRPPEFLRKLGHNPTAHHLIDSKIDIDAALKEKNIHFVRVAGTGFVHEKEQLQRQAHEASNITIAPPGDLNTLKEVINIIESKLNERQDNLDHPDKTAQHFDRDHPLIIENPQISDVAHFWDELLRGMKILDYNKEKSDRLTQREYVNFKALADLYGIYITNDREQTLKLTEALAAKMHEPVVKMASKPLVPEGSIIYVATGTLKKFREMEKIYKAQGINVRVRPIYELVDTYVSPKETSRTYEGNVAEKIHAALDAWHKMDEKTRTRRLNNLEKKYKVGKDKIFILAEDSGFHFTYPDVVMKDQFDDIRHKLDTTAPFPGAETGPAVFGSHGVAEFFRKAGEVIPEEQRSVIKKSILALAPLKQENYGEVKMHMVASETQGKFVTKPRPAKEPIEIDNFLVPARTPNKTEAEIGENFYIHESPRALAWKGLAYEAGITLGGKAIEDDYEKNFVTGLVVGSGNNQAGAEFEKRIYDNGFGVIKSPSRIDKAADIQTKILKKANGVVLAFDPQRAQQDFWENMYVFMSLIVGEQTHDKYKFLKPVKLVNPKGDDKKGPFDYLESLVSDFHKLGSVGEDPTTLFQSVPSVDNAIEQLQEDRKRYRSLEVPAYATAAKSAPDGTPLTKDFNVAIFCSATNENAIYREETKRLTERLIEADFGLVSGAGLYSSMGEITKTADKMRRSAGAQHAGSNVPHIMEGEGDARDRMQQFLLARNIYERMEFMMDNADSFIVTPGGTGTVQELALLALLKKHALENPSDAYAKGKMAGKDIIIVNTSITLGDKPRGFYDKLVEIIPPDDLKKLGIHIVDNVDKAIAKMHELRAKKFPDKYSYDPAETTKRMRRGRDESSARH